MAAMIGSSRSRSWKAPCVGHLLHDRCWEIWVWFALGIGIVTHPAEDLCDQFCGVKGSRGRPSAHEMLMPMRLAAPGGQSIGHMLRARGPSGGFLGRQPVAIWCEGCQPVFALIRDRRYHLWMLEKPHDPRIFPVGCPYRMFMQEVSIVDQLNLI